MYINCFVKAHLVHLSPFVFILREICGSLDFLSHFAVKSSTLNLWRWFPSQTKSIYDKLNLSLSSFLLVITS